MGGRVITGATAPLATHKNRLW